MSVRIQYEYVNTFVLYLYAFIPLTNHRRFTGQSIKF
jgi:hypothetical protein